MSKTKGEVTALLDAWSVGDPDALGQLLPMVIDDLRKMAGWYLRQERSGHTLSATALVNELYLRMEPRRTVQWANRAQFFSTMTEIMRHILVDHARRYKSTRKGGGVPPLPFDEAIGFKVPVDVDLVALDDALKDLAKIDARQSRIVALRFFCGLTIEQTAATLEISPMTVKREWRTARLWLLHELQRDPRGRRA
jgi:RNA polymerase sigma factor (TIGR02999 family)